MLVIASALMVIELHLYISLDATAKIMPTPVTIVNGTGAYVVLVLAVVFVVVVSFVVLVLSVVLSGITHCLLVDEGMYGVGQFSTQYFSYA